MLDWIYISQFELSKMNVRTMFMYERVCTRGIFLVKAKSFTEALTTQLTTFKVNEGCMAVTFGLVNYIK